MVNYYLERVMQALFTVIVVATLSFGMIRLMPGGPQDYMRAQFAQQNPDMDQEQIDRLVELHSGIQPNTPVWEQYISYMLSLFQGDLGTSMWNNQPVSEIMAEALPWTLFIMSVSLLLTFSIGITLGATMAYFEGERFDYISTLVSVFFNSVPYYMAALILVYLLSYELSIFPVAGRMDSSTTPGFNWPFIKGVIHHAILPTASMVLTGFGGLAVSMRGNSIRLLGEDFLRVARLRGLSDDRIAIWYVGRNAVLPLYTSMMISIGFMFGGSVILEEIFSYPGVGYYMFRAISQRDYPLMMGAFLLITIAVVIGILIADLTYGKIDPRAKTGGDNEAY